MRVLIVHARYRQPGGEEAVIDAQELALHALGHDVVRYEVDNAELSKARAATQSLWSVGAARAVGDAINRVRPDVMHVHNNFQQLSPSVYGAARRHAVPVVQHLHNARLACINAFFERSGAPCTDCLGRAVTWPGLVHNCYRGSRAASIAATAVQMGHRAIGAHRDVDRFVAVSAALADTLIGGGVVPAAKTTVCHNGIAASPSVRDDRGYALVVGRVSEEKGVQVLLDAAASVPELPVRIAGDGPALGAGIEQAARRGLHHVEFLGHVARDDLAREFAGARVTVAPSIGLDPLPTAVIEAAAAGVATIGSATGGIPEIVEAGRTGLLVPPGDVTALAAALRRAHTEPGVMGAMGAAARVRYQRLFTTEAFGRRLVAMYESLRPGQGL